MAKDRVEVMRGAFESKYGTPADPNKNVLIGMKSGKAVYGDALDATDTKGSNVINNTPSQNQAIMDQMFGQMAKSGGMYNPSPSAIAKMDQMYPPTAADSKVTTRADNKQVIGANSPEAKAMREPTQSVTQPKVQPVLSAQPQSTPNPMKDVLNPQGDVTDGEMTETFPSFYENFDYLKKLRKKQIKGIENPFDSVGQQAMV